MSTELSRERCRAYLEERWLWVSSSAAEDNFVEPLGEEFAGLKLLIIDCLTSTIKSYHYVLPTQLLCKCVEPSLDSRSLQAAFDEPGAFDARTIAHKVIVPFDQAHHRVLGGSPEPYVNNPLRYPGVTADYRRQQKNQEDWDKLVRLLEEVKSQDDETFTAQVFDQVLVEVYRLLAGATVVYPTPRRISLAQTIDLLDSFLSEKSGGVRIETVVTALFQALAERFNLFDEVRREKVNAPDAASAMMADIECYADDRIVLLVEVKDRALAFSQLDTTLDRSRARAIEEILFLAEQGAKKGDADKIAARTEREFVSGQNIYVENFFSFAHGILILFGEEGRADFISRVGPELDRTNAPIQHREVWARLLKQL